MMNVRRWDHVVHIVKHDDPNVRQVYANSQPAPNTRIVTMVCGRRAKMVGDYTRNRFTDDAPTCIVCVAGDYPDEQ